MKISDLMSFWEKNAGSTLAPETFHVRLSVEDAAKIQALAEMFPRLSRDEILSDLVSSALDELERSLPYVCGKEVVATDEMGDPLYEDVGPTPRYLSLIQKYLTGYRESDANHH